MLTIETNTSQICTDLLQNLPRRKSLHLETNQAQEYNKKRHVRYLSSGTKERSLRDRTTSARIEKLTCHGLIPLTETSLHLHCSSEVSDWCIPKALKSTVDELLLSTYQDNSSKISKSLNRRTRAGESITCQLLRLTLTRRHYAVRISSDTIYFVLHGTMKATTACDKVEEIHLGSCIQVKSLQKVILEGSTTAVVLIISDALNRYTNPH